ncbi:MAG: hypothetical protein RDU24_08380 [Humidesulfovibrio sp.]|uniref:hypothetical protein n=1 Tax=Humidesulfovibrio sp. TaxID=2910988 RepID=UPI0027E8A384|nr:hypothetical protein [Humidesulfovibrio sp.]MDQ7835385.1 hypothetical protein [Humidesulfovibrio sp.]
MHCIILLPDATGQMPTAEELRQRGFAVSAAVASPCRKASDGAPPASLSINGVDAARPQRTTSSLAPPQALAAEEPAPYGGRVQPE